MEDDDIGDIELDQLRIIGRRRHTYLHALVTHSLIRSVPSLGVSI